MLAMPKSTGTAQSLCCGALSQKRVKIPIGTLTTDEIRRFARLDIIKILKENDNFNRMRDEPRLAGRAIQQLTVEKCGMEYAVFLQVF